MDKKEFVIIENIKLRRAVYQDIWLFYEWANDPFIRNVSFRTQRITKEDHMAWFKKALEDPAKVILVGENLNHNKPVGYIRFESKELMTIISIALDKDFRGQGYGKNMLKAGLHYFNHARHKTNHIITAYIKNENDASRKLFTSLGFKKELQKEEFEEYSLDLDVFDLNE